MSPSWRDQLQIYFAPERVNFVRLLRGFKPTLIANKTATCEQGPDQQPWEAALHQLAIMLDKAEKTEMSITISNHFVRYVALPPQEEITTPEEVAAYAEFRMREFYADRVNHWELSVSAWNPSSGAICAAISRDLINQLQELATQHKVKLKAVTPYLVSAFDQWHKTFDNRRTCFVLVETGHFCIALTADNSWTGIRNQRILHHVEDELLAALEQEAIFAGHKEPVEPVRLFAPEHPKLSLPADCGWRIVPVVDNMTPVPLHFPSAIVASNKVGACAV